MMADPIIDFTEARATEDRRKQLSELSGQLIRNDKLVVLANVSNLTLIIGKDPVLAGLCGYDEFQCVDVLHRPPPVTLDNTPPQPGPYPRAWTAVDVSQVQSYVQRVWCHGARKQDMEDAMSAVAASARFHPIRDWLAGLAWDGTSRLNDWLHHAFGVEDTDFHTAAASCFLIAAVRRVRSPGVKFDHMLVLEGPQDMGKSTAVKLLFGEQFFTDSLPAALESRDAALGLQGAWCIELAEIEQMIRNEVEVIKAFLSRSVDRFRAPYGRTFLTYPRQCVIIGTTNEGDYLRDATGNRRFWPIKCKHVELSWLSENRTQLWAEAAAREAAGEDHWFTDTTVRKEASLAQQERQQEDVWEERVMAHLDLRREVSVPEIMIEALSLPVQQQSKREQMRIAAILTRNKWEKKTIWRSGKPVKRWVCPDEP